MERKNTGLKVLVVILTMLVLALGSFIVYDKILKGTPIDITNSGNNEKDNITNEAGNEINSESEDPNQRDQLWKMGGYNYYIKITPVGEKNSYKITLSEDGKVYINEKDELNTNNDEIYTIVSSFDYGTEEYSIFMLSSNNNVYRYEIKNYAGKNYNSLKIAENVKEIIPLHYSDTVAGGICNGLLGLTNNDNYIQLEKKGCR